MPRPPRDPWRCRVGGSGENVTEATIAPSPRLSPTATNPQQQCILDSCIPRLCPTSRPSVELDGCRFESGLDEHGEGPADRRNRERNVWRKRNPTGSSWQQCPCQAFGRGRAVYRRELTEDNPVPLIATSVGCRDALYPILISAFMKTFYK